MKQSRRRFLHLVAGTTALPFAPHVANSQSYPSRPVRWIVSFAAGGPHDTVARIIGQALSERLGQPVLIENKTGAGGNIGMGSVLSSLADGYTIGFAAPNNVINPALYENMPFDFVGDSTAIG